MKPIHIYLLLLLFTLSALPLSAQQPIKVEEVERSMSQGKQYGLSVHIHQALPKDVNKAWEKMLKSKAINKTKVEEKDDEVYLAEAVIDRITGNTLSIYSRTLETKLGVELIVYFKEGEAFLSPTNGKEKYDLAKLVLYDFAVKGYKQAVENELDAEDRHLKELNKELDKLMAEHKSLEGKIVDWQRDIEKDQSEVQTLEADQGRATEHISDQKDAVHDVKDNPDAKKEAEKVLKDLEKDLKKIHSNIDKLHKSIHNAESDIRQAEQDIATNLQDQEHKNEEITRQKDVIQKVELKLKGIK